MKNLKSILLLAFAGFFVGCGGGESTPPPPPAEEPAAAAPSGEDALIAEGKALFEGTAICHTCHGADASGTDLAPNLTDDEWLNIEGDVTVASLSAVIKNGVTEPKSHPAPMPPMAHLGDDKIKAIATYVNSL